MIALRGLKTIPFRQHAVAFIITLPALLACLGMQARASFYAMIFTGGSRVLFTNLCEVVLFPYFGIFILAWGSAFLPTCPATASDTFSQLDCAMTRFFRGVGIVTILGFVLSLLNLLLPAVTIPIFVVTLYVYFLYSPDQLWKVFPWLLTCDSPTRQALQKFPILRILLLCVRLGIPLVIIIVLLM